MKYYIVVSDWIEEVVPILDYGMGPTEKYKVYSYVKANNKREAKKIALKDPEMEPWIEWQRNDNKNPFSGLKVEETDEEAFSGLKVEETDEEAFNEWSDYWMNE